MNETFLIHANGVTIMVWDRRSVLNWINYFIEKGLAPTVERKEII